MLQRRPSSSDSRTILRPAPRALVRLGGVCGIAAAFVWAGHSAAAVIGINETLLTTDPGTDRDARAAGASTAFATDRGGTRDIFVLDGNGILSIAAGGPGNQDNPDIDGDLVVYVDDSLGNLDVGLVDLAAGTNQLIATDPNRDTDPVVDEDLVAFSTRRTGNSDIMLYDVFTGQLSFAAQTPNDELTPALDAGFLAWTVYQNGTFDIMARDVGGPAFLVAGGPGNEFAPSVSGDRIAYIVDGDVAVFDRATGLTVQLTKDAFDQSNVVIESDLVVWSDDRNGDHDLFLHDLSTRLTYQLSDGASDQVLGDLDGERVVFHDNRIGDFNLWELDITIIAPQDIEITEILLTVDPNTDRDARASEARTAFVTDRGGTRDVFMLDSNGALSIAAGGPGNQDNPDIDGDLVVYVDDRLGNDNIGFADLAAGTNQLITVDPNSDTDPVVDGDLVAFSTRRGGNSDILLYDVVTSQLSLAAGTPNDERSPALDAGFLAWTVYQNGTYDIMARDVDGPAFLVAGGPGHEVAPSVSGGRIAYIVDGDLAVFDRGTGLTTRLTRDAFDQSNVVIDGDLVVWSDDRGGNHDLFLHDLSTHLAYQLTGYPSHQRLGDLDGERVVFHDDRLFGNLNIWELDIDIGTPAIGASPFLRGDANSDGDLDVSDASFLLASLFLGGPSPSCRKTGDIDDSGVVEITDAIFLLNFLFLGGSPPRDVRLCRADPSPDSLTCLAYQCR